MQVDTEARKNWLVSDADWRAWLANRPVLAALHLARVVGAGMLEDGRLGLEESCDNWFFVALDAEAVRQLAAELIAIADQMDAAPPADAAKE